MHQRSTIRLNVGGVKYEIAKALIEKFPHTRLGLMMADPNNMMKRCDGFNPKRNEYFFSRPGALFDLVYAFYVDGAIHIDKSYYFCPHRVANELMFWGVPLTAVAGCCSNNLFSSAHVHHPATERLSPPQELQPLPISPPGLLLAPSFIAATDQTSPRSPGLGTSLNVGPLTPRRISDPAFPFSDLSQYGDHSEVSHPESLASEEEQEKTFRMKVWAILEQTDPSKISAVFMFISCCFIVATVVVLIMGSLREFQVRDPKTNLTNPIPELEHADTACVIWFTLEYVARVATAPKRLEYVKSVLSLIDLAAITPFYLELLFSLMGINFAIQRLQRSILIVRILRVMRVLRVLRVLKVARYSRGFQSLGETLKRSWHELTMMGLFMLTTNLIFSTTLYFVENTDPDTKFDSIPQAAWWCIITMTTVGYGDIYPRTVLGKIAGGVASIVGVLLLAFPISVVVQNFDEVYHEKFAENERKEQQKPSDTNDIIVGSSNHTISDVLKRPRRRAGGIWGGYRLKRTHTGPPAVRSHEELSNLSGKH